MDKKTINRFKRIKSLTFQKEDILHKIYLLGKKIKEPYILIYSNSDAGRNSVMLEPVRDKAINLKIYKLVEKYYEDKLIKVDAQLVKMISNK